MLKRVVDGSGYYGYYLMAPNCVRVSRYLKNAIDHNALSVWNIKTTDNPIFISGIYGKDAPENENGEIGIIFLKYNYVFVNSPDKDAILIKFQLVIKHQ